MSPETPAPQQPATQTVQKQSEQLFDTAMRVLRSNHNYKFFLGMAVMWLVYTFIL